MDKLIHTALNSMHSARLKQATSAQNLANAQVTGYRGDEIGGRFGSVYLSAENQLESRVFSKKSEPGLFSNIQGEMRATGEKTDVAIEGDGFFMIENNSGVLGMSRRGDFTIALDGTLVNQARETVLDTSLNPIVVPPFRELFISENGQIFIQPLGAELDAPPVEIGMIGTAVPDENIKLKKSLDGHIRIIPNINENGEEEPIAIESNQQARLINGFLEKSNVNAIDEMVNSLDYQRKFEMHIKFIQMAEELDDAGSSLMRLPGM